MFATAVIVAYKSYKKRNEDGDLNDKQIEHLLHAELLSNVSTLLKIPIGANLIDSFSLTDNATTQDGVEGERGEGRQDDEEVMETILKEELTKENVVIEHTDNDSNSNSNDDTIMAVGVFDVSLNAAEKKFAPAMANYAKLAESKLISVMVNKKEKEQLDSARASVSVSNDINNVPCDDSSIRTIFSNSSSSITRTSSIKEKARSKMNYLSDQILAATINAAGAAGNHLNKYMKEGEQQQRDKDNDNNDDNDDDDGIDNNTDVVSNRSSLSLSDIIVVTITSKERIVIMDYVVESNDNNTKSNSNDDNAVDDKSIKELQVVKGTDDKTNNKEKDKKKMDILQKSGGPNTILMDVHKNDCAIEKNKYGFVSHMYEITDNTIRNNSTTSSTTTTTKTGTCIKLKGFNYDIMNQNRHRGLSTATETAAILASYYSTMNETVYAYFDESIEIELNNKNKD